MKKYLKVFNLWLWFLVFSFSLFAFSFSVFAQYSIPGLPSLPGINLDQFSGLLNNDFFEVSKFSPLVGNDFRIKIRESSRFNPALSEIFWYVNGNLKVAGLGKDIFSFKPEQWGKSYEIKAVAKTPANNILQHSYKFITGDLNLTWSAQTSTPKDYQGLALATPGSRIKVFAQPMLPIATVTKKITKIKQEDAGKLFYRWFLDDKIQLASSGVGKSEFSFIASLTSDTKHIVAVEVENIAKTKAFRNYAKIKVIRSRVTLSKSDEKSIPVGDNLTLKKGETLSLVAQPYFFDSSKLSDLDFNWSFNGKKIEGDPGTDPNRLILDIPKEGIFPDNQLLSLFVASKNNVFQRFIKNINIKIE